MAIYDPLVEFVPGGTETMGGLATHWEISRDSTEYTFHLRRGVRWQSNSHFTPTRDFNAEDVVFTFNRLWKPGSPYFNAQTVGTTFFDDIGMRDLIDSVEKIDDYTVKISLNRSNAPFITNLAMPFFGIQSQEYGAAMQKAGTPERFERDPTGTGPFQLVEYGGAGSESTANTATPAPFLRYRAFAHYWRGRSGLDELVFLINPNAPERWAVLKAGGCHLTLNPDPQDLPQMQKDGNITVLEQPGLNVAYMAYNTRKKPFDDIKVRKALSMAINKEAILSRVYRGTAMAAVNPIPPTVWSYVKDLPEDVYDPESARRLLAEAGYPGGFETDLFALPVSRPYNPNGRFMAELIVADLARVGIKVAIKTREWPDYLKRLYNGEHQMALLGWTADSGDPDNFLYTLLSCPKVKSSNIAKLCYLPLDSLLTDASMVSDVGQRTRLYEKAQVLFRQQEPWFTIAHVSQFVPLRKEVLGFRVSPFAVHRFYGVDLRE